MKRFLALALVAVMAFAATACGSSSSDSDSTEAAGEETTVVADESAEETTVEEDASSDDGYEIALITDVGNIDDHSFNESTWNGVKEYAEGASVTYAYYRPTEDSTAARVETIGTAIDNGAKVVVCPGYLFEAAIYQVQNEYSDVQFLLLDGEPHSEDETPVYETASNVHCILYQEEQAGYLAGYAAVMDGYTQLGFLGGMAVPAVIRYGYGYVQGADAAAGEIGADVSVKYWYGNSFAPSDDIKNKMAGWYTEGTEVVFACGGGIYLSATAAAEEAGAKVIGVDVDQSSESETIITSAMKDLKNSVVLALTDLYANDCLWPEDYAGQTATLGAADGCVGLPTEDASWRLESFTVDQYTEIFDQVADGTITVDNSSDASATPEVSNITVDYQS